MNVYHRLLNILAEQLQPEYWTIDELCSFIDLAQRQFALDTRFFDKREMLVPAFTSDHISDFYENFKIVDGLYQVPDDCLEMRRVYWDGKLLEKSNEDFLSASVSGNGYFEGIKGEVGSFTEPVRTAKGEPKTWFYDGGIRIVPIGDSTEKAFERTSRSLELTVWSPEQTHATIKRGEERIDTKTKIYTQFATLYNITNTAESINLRDRQWKLLKYEEDYVIAKSKISYIYIVLTPKKIDEFIASNKKPSSTFWLFVQPSEHAEAEYTPVPRIKWDIKTVSESGVEIETPSPYHEAIASYSAFLALSKEGRKSQDVDKAQIYYQRYLRFIEPARRTVRGAIAIDNRSVMPFRL